MDILDFIASSEWPLIVGWTIWMMRKPLSEMVGRLNPTSIEAYGVKAEFTQGLAKVEQLVPPMVIGNMGQRKFVIPKKNNTLFDFLKQKSSDFLNNPVPPTVEILKAWNQIEHLIKEKGDSRLSSYEAAEKLGLGPDEVSALLELGSLRDKVAQMTDVPLTQVDAWRYKEAVTSLFNRILSEPKEAIDPRPV